VKVHDVSDPTDPREPGHWRDSATTDFWTARGAGDHVVASSRRDFSQETPEEGAAIYTFPAVEDAPSTPTPTPTPAAADDAVTGTPTSAGDGSGSGAAAGAAGLGLAALVRWLRD
jgi:hypothetical protein